MLAVSAAAEEYPPAPNFTLPDVDEKRVELKSLLGKGPVVVDFWATWCKPCKEQFPHFQKFLEQYGNRGLTIITIATDSPKTASRVKSYLMGRRFTFGALLDRNQEVSRLYKIKALPTTFLIDADGRIRYTHTGYRPGAEKLLEAEIQRIIKKA
jgi:peroxiredoxin